MSELALHKQLFRHDPEHGVFGDCLRTALACFLGLRPEEVPHFLDQDVPDWDGDPDARKAAWLRERGLAEFQFAVPEDGLELAMTNAATLNPGAHYMLSCISRTGCGHVVICRDGELAWDPSQTDAGVIAPFEDGYYRLSVLCAAPRTTRPS